MVAKRYLDKLRRSLCGMLLEPNEPGYAQSLVLDNRRINLQPGVVVLAANAQEVLAAFNYGGNDDRLCRIKEHWDPRRLFAFQQAIGSPFSPKTTFPPDLSPLFRTQAV